MTRVLRSATKKCQSKVDLSSELTVSKKSKTIKRRSKKLIKAKNQDSQQNDAWNINSIISSIFKYTDHKDLLEFNTVCKRWNHVSNPIVHKSIKLSRSWDILKQVHDKRFNTAAKIDADVVECISNNTKYANLVKELHYMHKLEPRRAIEVFGTFRFISNLTISNIEMSQDQFLGMISPLKQLQELTLRNLNIKRIIYKRLYKEAIQLPSSLRKLNLHYIGLINSPKLFVKTINSHNNLKKFSCFSGSNTEFLEPFYKLYSSLVKFEYENQEQQSPQSLNKIFEQNRQLISLKLKLNFWNNEFGSCISSNLTNLEEFKLSEYSYFHQDYTESFLKFTQPTKIKKLNLEWLRTSNCSLDSILLNCTQLEDLTLNRFNSYQRPNSEIFINISKFAKLKKLNINCESLSGSIVTSLLSSYPDLNELVISFPIEWKETVKSIYEKCQNLETLDISPPNRMYGQERDIFFQEFCETELFTCNSKSKSTLKNLTLNQFNVHDSKAEHFEKFEQLISIKYPAQRYPDYRKPGEKIDIDMDLWPSYKLITKDGKYNYDIELKKIQS